MIRVKWGGGNMSIVDTEDKQLALNVVKGMYGNDFSPYFAYNATNEDLDWLRQMGGEVIRI